MEHLTQKHIYKGQVYTKGSKLLTVLEDTNVWKIVSGKITHDQLWKFINFHEVVVSGRYIISDCCDGFRESDFMTLTYPIYIHDNFGKYNCYQSVQEYILLLPKTHNSLITFQD